MVFAFQYTRIYYNDLDAASGNTETVDLSFPGQPLPDLWDFMYYSFTIAMCYQTSDVSISGVMIRRLTLMHAIFSFLYVAIIIGFVVNILSNLL